MAMGVSGGEEGARRGDSSLMIITVMLRATHLAELKQGVHVARMTHHQTSWIATLLHDPSIA